MRSYSQNDEDLYVLKYFGDYKGRLLSIGENDGITYSNARLLIEHGWFATLVEPGREFENLEWMYCDNSLVKLHNYGIGEKTEIKPFWQSDAHVVGGNDSGLVSTFDFYETKRWPHVKFTKTEMRLKSFADFWDGSKFDFISIDAEGFDWTILKQIDMDEVGCSCLCIEHNGNLNLQDAYANYMHRFNMKCHYYNNENMIFLR